MTHFDSGVRVGVAGQLGAETAPYFLTWLNGHLTRAVDSEVELDLSGLTFLDVAGVRALLDVRDAVTDAGGRLVVEALDHDRLPVARVLGLDRYLNIQAS